MYTSGAKQREWSNKNALTLVGLELATHQLQLGGTNSSMLDYRQAMSATDQLAWTLFYLTYVQDKARMSLDGCFHAPSFLFNLLKTIFM